MVKGVVFRYPLARLSHTHEENMVFVHSHLAANLERSAAWTTG